MKRFFIGISLLILLSGCATTTFVNESRGSGKELKTLVIGQIEVNLSKIGPGYMALEGTHRANIEITIENIATGEESTRLSKGQDGYFYMINPDHLRYKIVRIKVLEKRGNRKMWYTIPLRKSFTISMNKVNNLGFITYMSVHRENEYAFHQDFEGHNMRGWFKETFPESKWNDKEWVDVNFEN